jgi:hypothetical protein
MSVRGLMPVIAVLMVVLALPASASAAPRPLQETGGAQFAGTPLPQLTVPGDVAVLGPDGLAAAPLNAPPAVQAAIWAANTIQTKPYVYGGGHGDFDAEGYDCSGTVSFALNAAGLLRRPRASGGFMRYGKAGPGRWITVYAHGGHAYMVIAGLRLDTSAAGAGGGSGPRWRAGGRPTRGYKVRHPVGF